MKTVTIDMNGISTAVQVNGDTNEECLKQALMKLYPERFRRGKYGELVFEEDVKSIPTVALHEELAKRAGVKEVDLHPYVVTIIAGERVSGPARILINKD